jgi:hypothetical protein
MPELTKLIFRYRGPMSYNQFYKETRAFFVDKKMDFAEAQQKFKSDELEGKFNAKINVDVYTQLTFAIEYKIIDVKFYNVEKDGKQVPMIDGKMWLQIEAGFEDNYEEVSIHHMKEEGGKAKGKNSSLAKLFGPNKKGDDTWFHKLYEKITFRDRDEGTYGEGIIIAHQYLDLLKNICNMQSRY